MNERTPAQPKTAPVAARSVVPARNASFERNRNFERNQNNEKSINNHHARAAQDNLRPSTASPFVREALRSPGQPLDASTLAAMQSRFGHHFSRVRVHPAEADKLASSQGGSKSEAEADSLADRVVNNAVPRASSDVEPEAAYDFSRVRIHTDEKAARSARSVNAIAYTVGSDIVFARNRYAPGTSEGGRLLAHELAHVLQQAHNPAPNLLQRQPAPAGAPEEKPPIEPAQSARPVQTAPPAQTTSPAQGQAPSQAAPAAAQAQPQSATAKAQAAPEAAKPKLELSGSDKERLRLFLAEGTVPLMPNEVDLSGNREKDTDALAEYFMCTSINDLRNPLDPDPLFCIVSDVTRSKPIFQEFKKVSIEPEYDKMTPAEKNLMAVRHWPKLLPTANRTVAERITVVEGKPEVKVPKTKKAPVLSKEQEELVKRIRAERDALPDATADLKMNTYGGNPKAGYMYGGKSAPKTPTGTVNPKDAQRTALNKVIWQELSGEGGVSAINTYDEQILTWGKGFGASTGLLRKVMQFLPPPMRAKLLSVGVAYKDGKWLVVDYKTGFIEEENNALRLLQFDRKLLGLLISESETHSEEFAESQWKAVSITAGAYPQQVLTWSNMQAVALAAHCIHWRSTGWAPYADTGGDIKSIVKVIAGRVGAIDPSRGGATFLGELSSSILRSFAGGVAASVMSGPEPLPTNFDATKPNYAGHIFFAVKGSNKFYHLTP